MTQKISTTILAIVASLLPFVAFAAGLVPDCGAKCSFDNLIEMVNKIIKFLMYDVAVPLSAIGFMVVGAKMVLSSNKESAKTEAKEAAMNIVKGFLIMLAAYVVVKTILYAFITDEQKAFMQFMFQ